MSILRNLLERRDYNPSELFELGMDYGGWYRPYGRAGGKSVAGKVVSPSSAEQMTAVFACVDLCATTHGMLNTGLYVNEGDARIPIEGPAAPQWFDRPTPEHTKGTWVEEINQSLKTWGDFFAQVVTDRMGNPVEVWPLDPARVEPRWGWEYGETFTGRPSQARELFYDVSFEDGTYLRQVPRYSFEKGYGQIFHIKGRGPAGAASGLSPIGEAMQAIGLGLTAEEFASRFFGSGATAGGVVTFPGARPEKKDIDRFKREWNEDHQGTANSHQIAVLWGGATYEQKTIPPQHAQFLELRRFQVEEIARLFRVPPHKIAANERQSTTGTSIEHQEVGFATNTMGPDVVRVEQHIERFLLPPGIQFRTDLSKLYRADTKTRYEAYQLALQNGHMTINEIRHLEDRPPVEDGDRHYLPINNLVPLDLVDEAVLARGGSGVFSGGRPRTRPNDVGDETDGED